MKPTHSPSTIENFFAAQPLYLAVRSAKLTTEHAQYFSPQVMLWNETGPTVGTIYIYDISKTSLFWRLQSERTGLSLYELFIKSLNEMCGSGEFQATLADHPWRAILGLAHMRERKLAGLVDTRAGIGTLLIQQISWTSWWKCISELELVFASTKEKRYRPVQFRQQALQLRRAAERLNVKQPAGLKAASTSGIKRRFGGLIRDIWSWGFSHDKALMASECEMPWVNFCAKTFPSVKRHLDYGLQEWEQIEAFLKDDLDRLCRSSEWTDLEKVVSLEWRLTFDDLTSHPVSILFRHPHCLHREIGHQRTTLLQAYYSFAGSHLRKERAAAIAAVIPKVGVSTILPAQAADTHGSQSRYLKVQDHPPLIVGWELTITERITIPRFMVGLFGDSGGGNHNLIDIENKLAVPLEAYHIQSDWQPEDAYSTKLNLKSQAEEDPLHASVIAAASVRPLFIFSKPIPYSQKGQSSGWQFLERTMAKWWEPRPVGDPMPSIQRDYYRMIDPDQRNYWVYKNSLGQWYMHGIFA